MAKPIALILKEIREAGLIYDPYITSTIINYEAGHLVRNCFYAYLAGHTPDEEQLRSGHLANARVELSDLITQARVLAEVLGWDFSELVSTGEAKLQERIDTYKARGVRPVDSLRANLQEYMSAPVRPPGPGSAARPYLAREGD